VKRLVAFLLIAGAGLSALAYAAGGVLGPGVGTKRIEVAPVKSAAGGPKPIDVGGISGEHDVGSLRISTHGQVSSSGPAESRVWEDPATGKRVDISAFIPWYFRAQSVEGADPSPSGDTGVLFHRVLVRLYVDPRAMTRAQAEALHADREGRPGPVRLEVEGDVARADFIPVHLSDRARTSATRTVVYLDGSVVIRDLEQGVEIHTPQAVVDLEARTAQGAGPLEAGSPLWTLRGRGFEWDEKTSRLRVFQSPDLDVRSSASAAASDPQGLKPTRVKARGEAVFARRAGAADVHDVVFRDDVRAEQEGGRVLSADRMELEFVPRSAAAAAPPKAPAAASSGSRLSRLHATGHVSLTSPGEGASPGSLSLATPELVLRIPEDGRATLVGTGPSSVDWDGQLAMPGEAPAPGRVRARCEETLTYGPPSEGDPASESALVLVGNARVEQWAAGDGPAPEAERQVLEGRVVRAFLARRAGAKPASADALPAGDLSAVAFDAEGDVRLAGPRVSGTADRLLGRDLDRPEYSLVAEGSSPRLVVAEAPPRAKARGAGGGPGPAREAGPRKRWQPDRVEATGGVTGRLEPGGLAGGASSPLSLAGDSLRWSREAGGTLLAADGGVARVDTLRGDGREDGVTAPEIRFRFDAGTRSLATLGPTHADVWVGGASRRAAKSAPAAPPRWALESRTRIRAVGVAGTDPGVTLTLADGASIERLEGDHAADRLEARDVVATLFERVEAPAAPASAEAGTSSPAAPPAAPAAGAQEPVRWTLDCRERLDLAFADATGGRAGGLSSLSAAGAVDVREAGTRLEGERLEYDGQSGEGALAPLEGKRTRVTIGAGDALQRVLAGLVAFRVEASAIRSARFAAPVAGLFHGRADDKGGLERYVLQSEAGDLVVEPSKAVVEAAEGAEVRVQRSARAAAGGEFGEPMHLTTPRLVLEATDLLARAGSTVDRIVAEGPKTRLEVGAGASARRAMGDRATWDRTASRMTITAAPGKRVYVAGERLRGDFSEVSYDPATGAWETVGGDAELELR
jgi:hypothetical protein